MECPPSLGVCLVMVSDLKQPTVGLILLPLNEEGAS